MSKRASAQCMVCSHLQCEIVFAYVLHDRDRDEVKVGISWHVTRRVGQLRKQRKTDIRLVSKREAGCRFTAPQVEAAIQERIGLHRRVTGDWFKVGIAEAVAALHAEIPKAWNRP